MCPARLNILYVTFGLPYPPDSGARIHDFNIIKQAALEHNVLLVSQLEFPEEARHLPDLEPYCDFVDVVAPLSPSPWRQIGAAVRGMSVGRPPACAPFFNDELVSKIRQVVTNRAVDILQIEHSVLAPHVVGIPPGHRCKRILSFQNLAVAQYRTMLQMQTSPMERLLFLVKWLAMLRWEARYAKKFDHCLVVSPTELEQLQASNPGLSVSLIENGVDTTRFQRLPEADQGNDLLFVGTMGYRPNADAVLYFHEKILPLIKRRVPDARLVIVGNTQGAKLERLSAASDVILTGKVPDVIPCYGRSRIAIAPLRAGGGTRLKILEAMALGRPVVTTALGCDGLEVEDGRHVMIADRPEEFAERVVRLLTDRALGDGLTRRARALVESRYEWSVIGRKLMHVYGNLTEAGKPALPVSGGIR